MADAQYQRIKEQSLERVRRLSRQGRDIGDIPDIKDIQRRISCEDNFRLFCETYFQHTFTLAWSDDHLKVIAKIEKAVRHGGLFAVAMPRGSGKTSLCEAACIWALLCGYRDFVCLIGASEQHAIDMLSSIKVELDSNDLLLADFPEALYPIAMLEGISLRCRGQLHHGERTLITWTKNTVVLPTIALPSWCKNKKLSRFVTPGGFSKASGAVIKVAGITGRIRGLKHKKPDGSTIRPTLVVVDDPLTDKAASSPSQNTQRERVLAGAILGLAGPGKKISGIMPCTVIRKGDMADNILNPQKHPEWNGERTKMVYSFPSNKELWQKYRELYVSSLLNGGTGKEATEFYLANRAAMDEGAVVAWSARYNYDEVSAVQHAMNLLFRDEVAFYAEYQNEPVDYEERGSQLTPEIILAHVGQFDRGIVPADAVQLVAHVDVQEKVLFYLVTAWSNNSTGYVVDYGAFPEQGTPYFKLENAIKTMADVYKTTDINVYLPMSFEALVSQLCGTTWRADDGSERILSRVLIDASWAQSTNIIHQFCRTSAYGSRCMPAYGRYVGASSRSLVDGQQRPGERTGNHWKIPAPQPGRARYVIFDTNYWKSYVTNKMMLPMASPGSLILFKSRHHHMLVEHMLSEYKVTVKTDEKTVDEWKQYPDRRDNHLFDCLVGCAVAASIEGVAVSPIAQSQPKKKIDFRELQEQRRNELRRVR